MRKIFFIVLLLGCCFLLPSQEQDDEYEDFDMEADGITVTGTKTPKRLQDSPVAVEVITSEEIENSGADTVTEVLADYGLVYTTNPMGDYTTIQGLGKNRVLYLINGRRVSGRIAQRLMGETLPLANVERIEIIRGPQSALYGSDALGGVINIITRRPPDKVTFTSSFINRFLLAHDDPNTAYTPKPFYNFNPLREQNLTAVLAFPIGISRNSVDVETARGAFYYNEGETASILPRYYRGRLGFDSSLSFDNGFELRFGGSGMLMRRDSQNDQWGSLNRLDYVRADGFVEAEFLPLDNALVIMRLYDNYYQRNADSFNSILNNWIVGERFENDNIAAFEIMGMMELNPRWILTAGFDTSFSTMEKYNLSKDFVYVDRQGLFVQAEYFKTGSFAFVGGLRGERNSQFGFAVSPKLSGMLHLGKGFRLFAGASLGYRAPDFSDLYMERDDGGDSAVVLGNPDLLPEYALGFNLGLEFSEGKNYFQITPYYTELFNEINRKYVEDQNIYHTLNTSRSLRVGVDSEGKISLPLHFFASAGYSYIFAWDREKKTELFPSPDHTVKTKLGWDLTSPAIYTYLQLRYLSKFREPARATSKQRFLLDYYFSIGLGKHFKLNLGVDNILGVIDRIGPDTAQTFYTGVRFTL